MKTSQFRAGRAARAAGKAAQFAIPAFFFLAAALPFGLTAANAADTRRPTVVITAPVSGTAVSGTITVSASASDNRGVVGVQFKYNGINLGAEDKTAPYSISANTTTIPNGSYTFTAVARDAAGNRTTSAPVTVTVANAPPPDTASPTVGITSPAAGATVSGTITLTANASDNVGVVGVQFKRDGVNISAEDTTAPYSVSANTTTIPNGSYTFTAIARDAAGNVSTSAPITVTVANAPPPDTTAPTVSIASPAAGGTVSGIITLTASASDNVGVVGVQFKRDGIIIGAEDTTPPFSISWNTATATNGTHTLTAAARDAAGNVTTSTPITITVANGSTPYTGTPIPLPGIFEAENFDFGGEGIAYHDNVAGNAGGQFRLGEDVDIVVSTDPAGGGYVVNNFETGEWLAYTVNVGASAAYDIEIRASTTFTNSAFHVEIDGVNVTGSITVPSTGNWSVFQWIGKQGVTLPAGTHVLKIVADQQYFNLNSIRVTASPVQGSATRLFGSGFEGATVLLAPSDFYGTGGWQNIVGLDNLTGFTWPPVIWGGGSTHFQLLADASVNALTIGDYMVNQIQTVTGHDGNPTRALYSEMKQSGCCGTASQGGHPAQDPFMIQPLGETSDLYVSYWLKHQPNLANLMEVGNATSGWNWRVVFEWKTAGDYRVIASIKRDPYFNGGNLYWNIIGDNEANGGLAYQKFWEVNNTQVPVAAGQWMKFEVYWHRSTGNDGRVWMAVNGQVIIDRLGPNVGVNNAPINRIMMPNLYASTAYPIYQWVDDVQIWDGFPTDAAPH